MLNSIELQNAYIDLYTELRNYTWDYQTVEQIAQLECEIFTAFPDMDKISKTLLNLYKFISEVVKEDKELKRSYEGLKELLELEEFEPHKELYYPIEYMG